MIQSFWGNNLIVPAPKTKQEMSTLRPKTRRRHRAPFGYYGAKLRLVSRIVDGLPPHNAWVEAFCGSAAVTLAKDPAPIEIINDLDGEIVNVFEQLRDNAESLCKSIALTPYARSEFLKAKKKESNLDPVERARRFLVSTMMTVNGTYNGSGGGFSVSQSYSRNGREARVNRWYNLPERLEFVVERLKDVRIENRDAREMVAKFSDRPATLMYLDPPYHATRRFKYTIDPSDEEFHTELLEACCVSHCMILISGYDSPLYKSILKRKDGWTKQTIQAKTRNTRGTDFSRQEVLWKNLAYTTAVRNGRVPIRLSIKEREQKKLNPPRKRSGSRLKR